MAKAHHTTQPRTLRDIKAQFAQTAPKLRTPGPLRITVIKGKQRRTFKRVSNAKRFAGRSGRVTVIVTN